MTNDNREPVYGTAADELRDALHGTSRVVTGCTATDAGSGPVRLHKVAILVTDDPGDDPVHGALDAAACHLGRCPECRPGRYCPAGWALLALVRTEVRTALRDRTAQDAAADRVIERQWLDTGSGPGAVVDVITYPPNPVIDLYGRLLDHLAACPDCTDPTGCTVAQSLRAEWRAARNA